MTRLVFFHQGNENSDFFGRLQERLETAYPGAFQIKSYDCYELNAAAELPESVLESVERAALTLMDIHGGLSYFRGYHQLAKRFLGAKPLFIRSGLEEEIPPLMDQMGITLAQYDQMNSYFQAGGLENYARLCLYAANRFAGCDYPEEGPAYEKWQCLYTPEGPVADEPAYLKAARDSGKPIVGVLVHEIFRRRDDMAMPDALYQEILDQGGFPVMLVTAIYSAEDAARAGCKGFEEALRGYFMYDGRPMADVIINTMGLSLSILSSPGNGSGAPREHSVFEQVGVPVLQAMQTYYSYEQWEASLAGLDPMMLSSCVYDPEFDGQIICWPICTREQIPTAYGVKESFQPIHERMSKLTKLALNWARLRRIPTSDKRVAVILHNMPPRNDMIGCAFGLDTPASVYNMVEALRSDGLPMEFPFEDGKDIMDRIIAGLTNDGQWLPEEEMLRRSIDTVPAALYRTWFDALHPEVQAKLTADWGEPPGDFMAVDGKLLVPGILNGNLFIGLQPPRAFEEKAEESYHSTDLVCPHQYIAFYRWVEHVFKADVIVHVGTHGTLEWLPGKEIALSEKCYPDIAIGAMPHVYIYNFVVTGEGMQAKRRSDAVLDGHMIPSMAPSGLYGELAEMEELLDDYEQARQVNAARAAAMNDQVWELAQKLHLDQDLDVTERPGDTDMPAFLQRVHLWISRIKESETRDGLHTLGQVPQEERMSNFLRLLTRVRNGDVPSLREAIGALVGLNADDLADHPLETLPDGRTKRRALDEIDELGQQLFENLRTSGYDRVCAVDALLARVGEPKDRGPLDAMLDYALDFIKPRLEMMGRELDSFLRGVHGDFVTPGPSGNPSRGNANVLPTGNNFYASDPGAIPTRAAWRVGQTLANQLLEREKRENGKIPESIAIVVYAGETMKTCGDDIAEILYLMGVRPVWLGNTDRVVGLDVIPLEELGRPRIDVTLRISGLFRDTFPNLIERIEDAVNLVAALDEPREMNFLRRHIDEEVSELRQQGLKREQAFERASARIFGCPPGTYGAGVDTLINSGKWTDSADLGNVYIRWSGHAYGRKLHGEAWQDQLRTRLAKATVTVKNESSVELDMLDSDDFYNYHGGLIAAVSTASGKKPSSYAASTADVKHIETLSVHEETSRIMRSRIGNPKWVEGLKRHGYKGAQEIAGMVDIVFGWDASADNVDKWMYDQITRDFVLNEENREWIQEVNPWALHAMSKRLLEAAQRGMWQADEDMLDELRQIYLDAEGDIEEIL